LRGTRRSRLPKATCRKEEWCRNGDCQPRRREQYFWILWILWSRPVLPRIDRLHLGVVCRWLLTTATSSSRRNGPQATSPERSGFLLLHFRLPFSRVCTMPPALITRAAPAATSHSCFGVSVNVISARPADTSASL